MSDVLQSFDAIELLSRYETPLLKDMEKDDDVLDWVAAFVGSDEFQDAVNEFCDLHAHMFEVLNVKGGPSEEQIASHEEEWRQCHADFLSMANAHIEEFLRQSGFSMDQYRARCDEELQITMKRQRHSRQSFFVQILMACMEYDQFQTLMKRAADPEYYPKQALRHEAENLLIDLDEDVPSDVSATVRNFLEFMKTNPDASLEIVEQEFEKLQIAWN